MPLCILHCFQKKKLHCFLQKTQGKSLSSNTLQAGDLAVFLMLMLTYLLFLMLAVMSVAIKSRKIQIVSIAIKSRKIRRMRQFQDTKKINALISILVLLAIQTPTYWLIINSNNDIGWKSNTILHVAHILAVLSCQFCLFLPKILPSVRKSFNNYTISSCIAI